MKFLSFPLTVMALSLIASPVLAADNMPNNASNNVSANTSSSASPLATEKDKVSYSIGLDIGKNFTKQGIELDTNNFMLGLEDGRQNKKALLSDEEIKSTIMALQTKIIAQQKEMMQKLAVTNMAEGKAFLEKNKSVPGVKTLSSGLQYRVITEGSGTSPSAKDTVKTHYKGTLINGTEFDSSYARGEPVEFPVEGVIKGWTEALQLMKPGAKWELFVPANLAYGENGAGNVIGPNSALVFQVELLSVSKANNAGKTAAKASNSKVKKVKKAN